MADDTSDRRRFRPGLVLWGVLAVVGLVMMAQNTDQTTVRLLGFTVEMPLFLLIALSLLLGWLLGALGWWLFRRREDRRRSREKKADRGAPIGKDAGKDAGKDVGPASSG